MNKIEAMIASKDKTNTQLKKGKGLLAPSKTLESKETPKSELDLIVGFVQSIRQAREEMKNG
jgi:hypothetical protein